MKRNRNLLPLLMRPPISTEQARRAKPCPKRSPKERFFRSETLPFDSLGDTFQIVVNHLNSFLKGWTNL
jgi:hypothetical protein